MSTKKEEVFKMKLAKLQKWYNPFYALIGDKVYCLDSISVFEDGKMLAHINQGWFGNDNKMDRLDIDCDCKVKRTIDFNEKCAFIVKSRKELTELRYDLYIPNSAVKLDAPILKKDGPIGWVTEYRTSSVNPQIIFKKIYFCDRQLCKYLATINEVGKTLSIFSNYNRVETLDECISKLSQVKDLYAKEEAKLKTLSAEELVKEYINEDNV